MEFFISEYTGYNLVYLIYLIFSPILWMAPNGVRRFDFLEFVKNDNGLVGVVRFAHTKLCGLLVASNYTLEQENLFAEPTVICVILAIRLNGTKCFT